MNTFTLKMIAVIAMLIDHVGHVLFPEVEILRIIGRIAFPIFAYVLVEGFLHTKDVWKYLQRLCIFAFLSEIPFDLAIYGKPFVFSHQNVFFTLALGLLLLIMLVKQTSSLKRALISVAILLLSEFLRTDYSSVGILIILGFYMFRQSKKAQIGMVALLMLLYTGGLQIYAMLGLIPIAFHNGEQGRKMKWFFYAFYPVHLLVLYVIGLWI